MVFRFKYREYEPWKTDEIVQGTRRCEDRLLWCCCCPLPVRSVGSVKRGKFGKNYVCVSGRVKLPCSNMSSILRRRPSRLPAGLEDVFLASRLFIGISEIQRPFRE